MSFDYNKVKQSEEHGNYWTSYSDLFMGLSVIFLLLYVTASLHQGTSGIQQQLKIQNLSLEVSDLKNQLKVYNNIRKDYLQDQASPSEQKVYSELMDKLTLLQEEAKDEKNRLNKAAQENGEKEQALNQYQQMVRNMINANTLAKTKIQKRDVIIDDQDDEIEVQDAEISDLATQVKLKEKLIADSESKIAQTTAQLEKRMKELKRSYKENQMTKANYEAQAARIRAESNNKVKDLQAHNQEYEAELADMKVKLGSTSQKLQQVAKEKQSLEGANQDLEQKKQELSGKVGALSSQLKDTEGLLAKAKADADARKEVAKEISREFKKTGIKADIDMGTGEVILDFGEAYFDNDSSKIKQKMAEVLRKAVPIYAKSLMENKKVTKAISSVEVVGFASPTYKGRYIDPNSLKPEDRHAFNYNMDLSYRRAKSIVQYIFDTDNLTFEHQKDILPLVKVSGRSFLEEAKAKRTVATNEEFCRKYDCKKAQRVIIRFNMDAKKK